MPQLTLALYLLVGAGIDPGIAAYDDALGRATQVRELLRISRDRLRTAVGTSDAARAAVIHQQAVSTWAVCERQLIQARYELTERLYSWFAVSDRTCSPAETIEVHILLFRLSAALDVSVALVAPIDAVAAARTQAARDVVEAHRRFRTRFPRPVPPDAATMKARLRRMMDLDRRLMWFFEVEVGGAISRLDR